ncbi:hypothetical protein BZG36_02169 [Bifiguratus adelaidae]|uniref:HTH araC/xylS-type domain-containing protein n=1 Tax=Bifiguratus adelaidae TaxID=1938954 RepID=A0A261Y0N8_9FUNG|nr:hypothetical protein BZG36_02169 [Bifiguratus adelaidae]
MPFVTDSQRWSALVVRDQHSNGQFVYAVKSTGIYCRPVCPSRLARRANVVFYSTPAEAAKQGFRACKRCKPDVEIWDRNGHTQKVEQIKRMIEEAVDADLNAKAFSLKVLANEVGLTEFHFHRVFKASCGLTPKGYANKYKNDKQKRAGGITPTSGSTLSDAEQETLITPASPYSVSDLGHFGVNLLGDASTSTFQPELYHDDVPGSHLNRHSDTGKGMANTSVGLQEGLEFDVADWLRRSAEGSTTEQVAIDTAPSMLSTTPDAATLLDMNLELLLTSDLSRV